RGSTSPSCSNRMFMAAGEMLKVAASTAGSWDSWVHRRFTHGRGANRQAANQSHICSTTCSVCAPYNRLGYSTVVRRLSSTCLNSCASVNRRLVFESSLFIATSHRPFVRSHCVAPDSPPMSRFGTTRTSMRGSSAMRPTFTGGSYWSRMLSSFTAWCSAMALASCSSSGRVGTNARSCCNMVVGSWFMLPSFHVHVSCSLLGFGIGFGVGVFGQAHLPQQGRSSSYIASAHVVLRSKVWRKVRQTIWRLHPDER